MQTDAELAELLPTVAESVPAIEIILTKKAEGRPITPEEYTQLSQFVDRVERRTIQIQEEAIREEEERVAAARAEIPATAFDVSIYDAGIKEHILNILTEAEYETVGDLMLSLKIDPDKVLGLAGIGPKAMENIEESLAELTFPEPEPESEPEPEPEAEVEAVEAEVEAEETPVAEQVAEPEAALESPEVVEQLEDQPEAVAEAVAEAPVEEKGKEKKPRKKDEEEISEDDDMVKDDVSLDELFALKEMFQTGRVSEDEDDDESEDKKKKSKKKKKKHVKMVYDEELGEVVARKKHKRGGDDFEEDW
jgi:hypothetical protein